MKICLAQIRPTKGSVQQNLLLHENFVDKAANLGADLIVFPELSLTGYEPALAQELAFDYSSELLENFQALSDGLAMTIVLGCPLKKKLGVSIGSFIFQPNLERTVYSKRFLHEDEVPFFHAGNEQLYIQQQNQKIGLAICYEVFVETHAREIIENKSTLYLASVAKTKTGMERAHQILASRSKTQGFPTLIVNSVGHQDNFLASGTSAVWNSKGELLAKLDDSSEAILIYDSISDNTYTEGFHPTN
jgi:predicted amidohydrolase